MTEPRIKTERLILRPPVAADAAPLSLHAGDARVARMTGTIPHPYPPGAAEAMIEAVHAGRWRERLWIVEADGGAIGCVGVKPEGPELGYWMAPIFWGVGLATEAVEGLCRYLFDVEKLESLEAVVFADNPASHRVLEKSGFVESGRGTGFSVARGASVDTILMHCAAEGRAARLAEAAETVR